MESASRYLDNILFVATYTWDSDQKQKFLQSYPEADLRITSPSYWLTDLIAPEISVERLSIIADPLWNTLYMTVPQRVPPAPENFSSVIHASNLWIKKTRHYYLPLEEMSNKNVFFRNDMDGTHFQCGFIHHWGEQSTGEYKTPISLDCRDMMNLNIVMMLVHHLHMNVTNNKLK